MTDANDKLTMPPGFRWAPIECVLMLSGGGFIRIFVASHGDAIRLAHDTVRPAVGAATAELRAQVEKAEADAARYRRDHEAMEALREYGGAVLIASADYRFHRVWFTRKWPEAPIDGGDPADAILAAASRGEGA